MSTTVSLPTASAGAPAEAAAGARQTIHIHNRAHRPFAAQPVTYGVPWPLGAVRETSELMLRGENGQELPAAFTELNRWPDGSLQWTLLDTALDLQPSQDVALTIEQGKTAAPKPPHGVV